LREKHAQDDRKYRNRKRGGINTQETFGKVTSKIAGILKAHESKKATYEKKDLAAKLEDNTPTRNCSNKHPEST